MSKAFDMPIRVDGLAAMSRGYHAQAFRTFHHWARIERLLGMAPVGASRAVVMAILYHDVVYRPGSGENGRRSAALLRADAAALGENAADIAQAADIIESLYQDTPHTPDVTPDATLVRDLTLAWLAQDWAAFRMDHAAWRAEFHRLRDDEFDAGERVRLEKLQGSAQIYTSGYFAELEQPARDNICRVLVELG